MLKEFYQPFHAKVIETEEKADKHKGERRLGKDPRTGKNIYAKIARYGAVIQRGESKGEEKPDFAKINKKQSLNSITLEEALKLLKFPRKIGNYEGKEMVVGLGKYGPYIRHNSKFASIKKPDTPDSIDNKRAIEIIEESRKQKRKNILKEFVNEGMTVINGIYGPYISFNKKNYKIPKTIDAEKITIEECKEIIDKKLNGKKGKKWQKRK